MDLLGLSLRVRRTRGPMGWHDGNGTGNGQGSFDPRLQGLTYGDALANGNSWSEARRDEGDRNEEYHRRLNVGDGVWE